MKRVDLEIQPRDLGQKDVRRNPNQMRREGWVPAVLYGHGKPVSVAVNQKILDKAIHTEAGINALFNIKLGGKTALGMIKDIQRDIFTQDPIHVDFFRINVKEKIEVHIPIRAVGVPVGVKDEGGILEHIQREVHLRCLPDQIPPHVDVDVTALNIHQSIKVADLKWDAGIEVLTPGDHIIVNVVIPKVEEEPAPAEVAEAVPAEGAEPEVIAKGKKEEEGKEGAPAKAGAKDVKEGKEAKK